MNIYKSILVLNVFFVYANGVYACDPKYMDCYENGPWDRDEGVGIWEGALAFIAFAILISSFKWIIKIIDQSRGILKIVPIVLIAGLFVINDVSKSAHTDRIYHILILLTYLAVSFYICLKLDEFNNR